MKKYSWIVALFLALTLAFVFASCGGETDPDKDKDGDKGKDGGKVGEDGSLVVENPKFSGWGGLGSAENNSLTFVASTQYNCRATYVFPAGMDAYTKFTITFDLTKGTTGETTKPMKLIFGDRSKDQWGDSSNSYAADSTFNEYKDVPADVTGQTYTHTISANKQVTIEQNWGSNKDSSADFTVTITKIEFTK